MMTKKETGTSRERPIFASLQKLNETLTAFGGTAILLHQT
jgi:hypothetical protein